MTSIATALSFLQLLSLPLQHAAAIAGGGATTTSSSVTTTKLGTVATTAPKVFYTCINCGDNGGASGGGGGSSDDGGGVAAAIRRRDVSEATFNSTHDYYDLLTGPSGTFGPEDGKRTTWQSRDDVSKPWMSIDFPNANMGKLVTTSFSFPFYGHRYRKLRVTSGGFISMASDGVRISTGTYYIAPLMAGYNVAPGTIFYRDMGDRFYMQWDGIQVSQGPDAGSRLSFQLGLFADGGISFVYKSIGATSVAAMQGPDYHPVAVGISDSYSQTVTHFGRSSVLHFEYHAVDVPFSRVLSGTAAYFTPRVICRSARSCTECLLLPTTDFDCDWCPGVGCSDGTDRFREQYLDNSCDTENTRVGSLSSCPPEEDAVAYPASFLWPYEGFPDSCWNAL
eukprot:UC1_evm1s190